MAKISVIMGVLNSETTLEESLNSLLNQSFQNFEVVACDDGSTDSSMDILLKYKEQYPEKFVIIKNDQNMGLNYTLNRCLEYVSGDYVARMDADDVSEKLRFEKQSEFLDNNLNIGFVSSNMIHFDESGEWGISKTKETPLKKDFIYNSPFPHAPVMIRKEAYKKVGGYTVSKRLLRVEDYHLWVKLYAAGYRGYNIQEPLYKMRDDKNAYNRRTIQNRINGMYVRIYAINTLKLPKWALIYSIRPILVGMLPKSIYDIVHKQRLKKEDKN